MSQYLLDTNVVSELLRPEPHANVERFVAGIDTPLISAAVFQELAYGVELLPDGARKYRLLRQIEAIQASFSGCTVAISADVAALSGRLRARVRSRGGELKALDALIGASAMSIPAVLVTRNTKDFVDIGVELLNPWLP